MIKNLLVGLILLMVCTTTYGQNESYDSRLLSLYSHDQITDLQNSNPDIISYWEFYLNEGYFITDYDAKKHASVTEEVTISDDLNLLEMKIYPNNKGMQRFVDHTNGKVLSVLPSEKIVAKLNELKQIEISE